MKEFLKVTLTIIVSIIFAIAIPASQHLIVSQAHAQYFQVQTLTKNEIDAALDIGGKYSTNTWINHENSEAYMVLYSFITPQDEVNLWKDINILHSETKIRNVNLMINSLGGGGISGLAIADQIIRAKQMGFYFTAYATGAVASAALPAFLVCDSRIASESTLFMIHEPLGNPGQQGYSQHESYTKMLTMIIERYNDILKKYSMIPEDQIIRRNMPETWFSVHQAFAWKMVDDIR